MEQLDELGFYTLAGHTDSPRDLLDEAREAEALGLGAAFVSERFNLKDASTLCGAVAAVTESWVSRPRRRTTTPATRW